MPEIIPFDSITPADGPQVGGKGLSLGLCAAAGLPVPPGFCITSEAFRAYAPNVNGALREAVQQAYTALGGGPVAVRSSATAEDGEAASFAGQQETILGVEGNEALQSAIERCWASLHTDRAKAYRARQGIDEATIAMAVVVQRLVEAETAGVLFTRDPLDSTGSFMAIEAAWGLGEAVVSGRVTPDRFQVDRETGAVRDRQAGHKHIRIDRDGEHPVGADRQSALCLRDDQLAALAELGRRVEAFYGDPRDIEWAWADGRPWLLQARPITTAGEADREKVRRDTIERLSRLVEPGGTVWSRTNLIEVLAEPTPMTWALVSRHLLSGGGGTGMMYRDFGFNPDPALKETSAYDLIGGRPYLNLAREPRLESAKPLAGYPLAAYKADPNRALNARRESPRGMRKWLAIPSLIKTAVRISSASKSFADEFRSKHVPSFVADTERARGENLQSLTPDALFERLEEWTQKTLIAFARQSLKPTLLAQFCWQLVEHQLAKAIGPDRARAVLAELGRGAKADPEADLPGAIRDLASGTIDRATFLARAGHRGPNEMELSAPRWSEDFGSLERVAGQVAVGAADPATDAFDRVAREAKWDSVVAKTMADHVARMQTYLGLRETGKHHLMRGYAIIRQTLLELDRRFGLHGGVFFLLPEELPDLVSGKDLSGLATARRKQRALELSLPVPPVVFGDDLEVIGRPLPIPPGADRLTGIGLSPGVAEGPALVLTRPTDPPPVPGYVLVCPSTDPAWVPLFVHASALVMESGGTLSHGAIVAREFGLPAVAGLPGVQHRLQNGQRLRVDGGGGTVVVLS